MSEVDVEASVPALLATLIEEVRGLRAELDARAASNASPLLDPEDLAAMLKVAPRTLRRLELLGQIPTSISIGAAKRWRRADVDEWLAGRSS